MVRVKKEKLYVYTYKITQCGWLAKTNYTKIYYHYSGRKQAPAELGKDPTPKSKSVGVFAVDF